VDHTRVSVVTNATLRSGTPAPEHLTIRLQSPRQVLVEATFQPSDYAAARRLRVKGFRKIHNGINSPERRKNIVTTVALLLARRGSIPKNG
jgi:hypothetical protein